jgi:hypothetical protein
MAASPQRLSPAATDDAASSRSRPRSPCHQRFRSAA